ncbi:magnesium transporter [Bacillus cytotoxicus]
MKERLEQLLISKNTSLIEEIMQYQSCEIAKEIERFPLSKQVELMDIFPVNESIQIMKYLIPDQQYSILINLPKFKTKIIMNTKPNRDLIDFLLAIHSTQRKEMMHYLDGNVKKDIHNLISLNANNMRGLLENDYISIREAWSVKRAFSHIRKTATDIKYFSNIYIVDNYGYLNGVVSIHKLLSADDDVLVSDIMIRKVVTAQIDEDSQSILKRLTSMNVSESPVVTKDHRLIGSVALNGAIYSTENHHIENTYKLDYYQSSHQPYLNSSIWSIYWKRIPWLLVLFIAEAYTSTVISYYEEVIAHVVALSFFIPLLIGTGGNTGTQVVTTLVCALKVEEIKFKDIFHVMKKEILVGIFLGFTLGGAALIRAYTLGMGQEIAKVVAISALFVVIWSSFVASVLPLILNKLKLDATVISGPFITTLVDGTGLIIYFTVAKIYLNI